MKIALVGGHFTTALAVIDVMPKETEILFIGRKYTFEGDKALSLEYQTIKNLQIPFFNLTTARLQRKVSRHTVPSLIKLPVGFSMALGILRLQKPDVVVTFGGYLSIPVGIAAYILRIPLVIHEQTLAAGLANKVLSRFARRICLSWIESAKYFPRYKTILTGNPMRKAIITQATTSIKKDIPVLYITGGSAGAHAINSLIQKILPELLTHFKVIHQTGDAKQFDDFAHLEETRLTLSQDKQERYSLYKFILPDDVGTIMQTADIIVSRSGINTISELLYFGKPCLLIPLPFAQKDEQRQNAKLLVRVGIAEVLEQESLTPELLLSSILTFNENLASYQQHTEEAKEHITKDAAQKIEEVILSVVAH